MACVLLQSPSRARGAPRSVYNGDAFTRAPNTPSGSGDGSVGLQSGTYSYTYAIDVPPGRLGMQPSLALRYSSDAPIYGGVAAGWALDLPTIQLDTSQGLLTGERHWISSLAGGERLIPTNDMVRPGVAQVYRARYDLTGMVYERYASGSYEWVARAPDGAIYRFGKRGLGAPVAEFAVLNVAEDAHGNTIDYDWSWTKVPIAPKLEAFAYQLDSIRYTSNPGANLAPFARVDLAYESPRTCENSYLPVGSQLSTRTGTPIIHGYGRLKTIATSTVDRPANGGLVRTYSLIHDWDEERCDLDAPPRRQLLGIKSTGYAVDGSTIDAPPVTFTYHPRTTRGYYPSVWTTGTREDGHLHLRNGMFVDHMLVDLDGDGLPDRLTSDPADDSCAFYWQRNTGFGFEETRRHVNRPRLPYGVVPDDWAFDDGLGQGHGVEQRCALNVQHTLVVSPGADPDGPCRHNGKNYRRGSMVNWRFMDADRDGLVDMVAGVDVNELAVRPDSPGFDDQGLLDQIYDRQSDGSFYGDIAQLLEASKQLYEGDVDWACESPVPVEENKSYPWIVFRNTGTGKFAAPETWAMPVPLLGSSSMSRKEIGEDQVGPFADITFPAAATVLADPFSLVDVDGDGISDVVSSFKSKAELDGGPPSDEWKVYRGRPDGLFEARDGLYEPYSFNAPTRRHANGIYVDGGLNEPFVIDVPVTNVSFAAAASGLHELNGDGIPEFAWVASDSYDPAAFQDWNTTLFSWLGTSTGILSCHETADCTLVHAPKQRVGDGAISNLSVRVSSSSTVREDFDGDGEYDNVVDYGTSTNTPNQFVDIDGDGRQDLVSGAEVRYNAGDTFLDPRPLPSALDWAAAQREFSKSSFRPSSFATTLLMDMDGDGRMDPMVHQVTALDPDGNHQIDGVGLEVFEEPGVWSVYLASREPQGLLSRIDNGMGGKTYIDYASVRDDWVVEDWSLPLQTWVVSAVNRTGGTQTPAQVTTYYYRDPAWVQDDHGRYGFRGFREVTVGSPTGSINRSFFAYDLQYKGLATETIVADATLPGEPARTIHNTIYEPAELRGVPLVVPRRRDARTCGAVGSISDCRSFGALVRTQTDWKSIGIFGMPQMYVPWREATAQGQDVSALGTIVTETEYDLVVNASSYRIKPRKIERREITAQGEELLERTLSVYDPTLRQLRENHLQVDDARVAITKFTQDPDTGLLISSELPESVASGAGQVTTTVYDTYKASVRQVVNPLGHVVTTIRDLGTGAILTTQGPQYKCSSKWLCWGPYLRWRTTVQRYDALGRPTSLSKSFDDGATAYKLVEVERHSYLDSGGAQPIENRVVTERRMDAGEPSLWTRSEAVMDGLGRTDRLIVNTFDPTVPDAVTLYRRDRRGLVIAVETPDPSRTDSGRVTQHYEYDGLGRMVRTWSSSGLGGVRHVDYDGLATATRLESGDAGPAAQVRLTSDARGRLVRVEERTSDGPWAVTEYEYDGNDNLSKVIDADGLVTLLRHDLAGRRRWVERGARRWSYDYDLEGRITTSTVPHPAGQEAAYTSVVTYDELGRIKTRTPAPGALTPVEQAELAFGPIAYLYDQHTDAIGAASTITTPASAHEFRYDPSGNLVWSSQRFTAPGAPTDVQIETASYNALGNVSGTVHADGTVTTYTYDRRGLPRDVSTSQQKIAEQVRNPAGLVVSRTHWNGTTTASRGAWWYDALGRLREHRISARMLFTLYPIGRQFHDYFSSGDVRHVEERILDSYRSFDFTYDQQSQLRSAQDDRGYHGQYDYTPAGRLLDVTLAVPAGADTLGRDVFYDYDTQDLERVRALVDQQSGAETVALGYDDAGSITQKTVSGGTTTYRYDGDGRLRIVVRGGEREVYHYDANGKRMLAIRSSGGTVVEIRRQVGDLRIHQIGGATVNELTIDLGTPVARLRNGTLEHLHQNATGNLLIALQANGAFAAGFSYGAFGEILETQGPQAEWFDRRYQDRERDELSGWYDYGHRLYDPETLIWNRVDPLFRMAPDAAGSEPRRMALYTFSLNNPLRYVDPDGRDPYDDAEDNTPQEVKDQKEDIEQFKKELPTQVAIGLVRYGEVIMAVDVTGISDGVKLAYGLAHGDTDMIMDAGGDMLIGAAIGFGVGMAVKGFARIAKWGKKADDVGDGAGTLDRLTDVSADTATAGVALSDVPDAFARNGRRAVHTQPAGKGHCMVDSCGMVLETMGKTPDPAIMDKYRKLADKNGGLTALHGAELMREHGVWAAALTTNPIGTKGLERFTARGTPVIAIQMVKGPRNLHAIVVDGVTTKPTLGKVASIRNPWGFQYHQKFETFWKKWNLDTVVVWK